MMIESFIPNPDAIETHRVGIAASSESAYKALWTADLGGSPVIKSLMALDRFQELFYIRADFDGR
jgi:hypothetical protein